MRNLSSVHISGLPPAKVTQITLEHLALHLVSEEDPGNDKNVKTMREFIVVTGRNI